MALGGDPWKRISKVHNWQLQSKSLKTLHYRSFGPSGQDSVKGVKMQHMFHLFFFQHINVYYYLTEIYLELFGKHEAIGTQFFILPKSIKWVSYMLRKTTAVVTPDKG